MVSIMWMRIVSLSVPMAPNPFRSAPRVLPITRQIFSTLVTTIRTATSAVLTWRTINTKECDTLSAWYGTTVILTEYGIYQRSNESTVGQSVCVLGRLDTLKIKMIKKVSYKQYSCYSCYNYNNYCKYRPGCSAFTVVFTTWHHWPHGNMLLPFQGNKTIDERRE